MGGGEGEREREVEKGTGRQREIGQTRRERGATERERGEKFKDKGNRERGETVRERVGERQVGFYSVCELKSVEFLLLALPPSLPGVKRVMSLIFQPPDLTSYRA